MANPTLTRERIEEIRWRQRSAIRVLVNMLESTNPNDRADAAYLCDLLNATPALLYAAESALELREERDRLRVELDELKALASKSELAMAEDWRLATTAAVALKDERDRLQAHNADLQIACNMYETSIDRLTTFVDEEYGMQPVAESSEALVSMLEQLAFERRQRDEVERKERDRLRRRVAELEEDRSRAVYLLNTGAPFCDDCHSEGCAFTAEAYIVLTEGSAALVREEPSQ